MKRSQRWNNLQICPHHDLNMGGSHLWSNTLLLDQGGTPHLFYDFGIVSYIIRNWTAVLSLTFLIHIATQRCTVENSFLWWWLGKENNGVWDIEDDVESGFGKDIWETGLNNYKIDAQDQVKLRKLDVGPSQPPQKNKTSHKLIVVLHWNKSCTHYTAYVYFSTFYTRCVL